MSSNVSKARLIQSVKDVFVPVLDKQVAEGTIADPTHEDTTFVDLCRSLVDDIEWMFRYTIDGETWSHVDDLAKKNPFSGFLSVDTVATEEVYKFLYERSERYFRQSLVRTPELDWFYLDFVVAVSYRVLLKEEYDKDNKAAYPVLSRAIDDFDGSNYFPIFKYLFFGLIKNSVIFSVALFLFLVASDGNAWAGFLGGGIIIWKLYGWYSQSKLFRNLRRKSDEKAQQINALYKLFSDGLVRWELLEHDIKRLRDLSIEFPLVLDTAITSTKDLR